MVAESLPSRPGRHRVVTTELDFPTLLYQWRVKPEMEVVVLPSSDGVGIDLDQYREAVDDRTAVVATSHVFFATGFVQDAAAIAGIARDAGAVSVIDGYQSVGQIPVDVESVGADAYTTGPLKWLCGGPGLSYLHVRPERIDEWEPRITSWFAAADQFDFDPHDFRFRDDARRFELGTPPLPTIHTSLGGQEILSEVGIERVAARNRALTERVVGGCRDAGFDLRIADEPRRSAIVMIRHPDPPGAVDALDRDDIIVDHRPGHVRVSPHVYNTDDEIDRFVEALARTL
jgi:kynureninase